MKRILTAILVATLAVAALGAAPAQKIVYALAGEAQTLDPTLNQYARASIVLQNLFRGLYRMDENDKPVPAMAASVALDSTKTVYTFKIADGAKWSDGKALTAQDFEYSWKRVLDPKTASQAAFYLYYLKNGKPANEGKVPVDQVGVQAVDAKTLKVTLENPTPYFLDLLCVTAYFPVRKDVVEAAEPWTKSAKTYICNGPFYMAEIKPKEKYVLKKNPNYIGASKVKLDTLEMVFIDAAEAQLAAYANNEIQIFDDPSIEAVKKYQNTKEFQVFPRIGTMYYDINTSKKPFDDPRVRRAFALSINREQVIKNILQTNEKAAFAFVPYGIPHGVQTTKAFRDVVGNQFKEDVAEAKKLLAAAGFPDGKNFPQSTIICSASQLAKDIVQALQAMWKTNLGVTVDIVTFESKVYWDEVHQGNFNIAADGWTGDYPDPMTNLEIFESSQNVQNNRWSNAEYDALIKANLKSSDQKVRMDNFAKAEKILCTDMPVIPMYYYQKTILCKPNVKGVHKNYIGHTFFEDAYVE